MDTVSEGAQRDVDAVLRRIPVPGTYSANLFRITGLAGDAGATAVRRRREELGMAARLGTVLPSPWADLAPAPAPDAGAVKDAFEALTAPLVRLVHEAFWLDGTGGAHDEAVAAHCRALDGGSDEDWAAALAHWFRTCESTEFWERLERRVEDLDDPRVQQAHLQALRTSIPRRVLAPNAQAAAAAAAVGDAPEVQRHLELLAASPFDRRVVAAALREASASAVERVHDLCSAVLRAAAEEPEQVVVLARRLLDAAPAGLAVPTAVLPADDPLPGALHDEVATTVVRAAVAHVNAGGAGAAAVPLLDEALAIARDHTTVALLERTIDDLAEAEVRTVIKPWLDAGDPNGAVEVLQQWAQRTEDAELRHRLKTMAANPRAVRAELSEVPSRTQFLGCGVRPFGRRAEADETWVETRCVTVFWIPVHSLAAYLSDDEYVYAKVPFSPAVRRARVVLPAVIVLAVVLLALGIWIDLALGAAVAVALGAAAYSRRQAIGRYLDERTDPLGTDAVSGEVRYG
ncbi:MAG: hypothetical protein ACT4QF_00805 [Sporichthyaceae bacterium]